CGARSDGFMFFLFHTPVRWGQPALQIRPANAWTLLRSLREAHAALARRRARCNARCPLRGSRERHGRTGAPDARSSEARMARGLPGFPSQPARGRDRQPRPGYATDLSRLGRALAVFREAPAATDGTGRALALRCRR